jgi:hypothetical protein
VAFGEQWELAAQLRWRVATVARRALADGAHWELGVSCAWRVATVAGAEQ